MWQISTNVHAHLLLWNMPINLHIILLQTSLTSTVDPPFYSEITIMMLFPSSSLLVCSTARLAPIVFFLLTTVLLRTAGWLWAPHKQTLPWTFGHLKGSSCTPFNGFTHSPKLNYFYYGSAWFIWVIFPGWKICNSWFIWKKSHPWRLFSIVFSNT